VQGCYVGCCRLFEAHLGGDGGIALILVEGVETVEVTLVDLAVAARQRDKHGEGRESLLSVVHSVQRRQLHRLAAPSTCDYARQ